MNASDPSGMWGLNPLADISQAAHDVGHYVAKHKVAIAEFAVGAIAVVGATVLTAGVGGVLLTAATDAVEESAIASTEFAVTGSAGSLWGSFAFEELAVHAPFVLGPGLGLGAIGAYGVYRGIRSLASSQPALSSSSACRA